MATTTIVTNTIAVPPVTQLWHRQIWETAQNYARFVQYRDLPSTARSYADAAKVLGLALESVELLGREGKWKLRAEEYDAYIYELASLRSLESKLVAANQHARMADKMVRHVDETLDKYLSSGMPIPIKNVAQLAETGIKLARQARGETDAAPVMQATAINVSFGAGADGNSRVPLWAVDSKTIDASVTIPPHLPPADQPAGRLPLSRIVFGDGE